MTPTTSANTSPISARTTAAMQPNENVSGLDPHSVEPPNMSSLNTAHSQNVNIDNSPSHKQLSASNLDSKGDYATTTPSPVPAGSVASGAGIGGSVVGMHITSSLSTAEQQLKYENERLKLALAQRYSNTAAFFTDLSLIYSV